MKFGQSLHHFQIAPWAPNYINYSDLKARYKDALRTSLEPGRTIDLSGLTLLE